MTILGKPPPISVSSENLVDERRERQGKLLDGDGTK
jgi:hypothetical protein